MKPNINNVSLLISAGMPSQFPRSNVPQIAFSGRSNVGKSSLINTLLERKALARTSSTPGKTITVNFYDIDGKMLFADLPGYGYARRTFDDKKKWSALVDGYFTKNPNIDLLSLVVQLTDSRVGLTDDDRDMISFMNEYGIEYVVVATKTDKLNKSEREKAVAALKKEKLIKSDIIMFSSETKEGKRELFDTIMKYAFGR